MADQPPSLRSELAPALPTAPLLDPASSATAMTSSSADAPRSEIVEPYEPATPSIAADVARFYNFATKVKEGLASTRAVFRDVINLLPQLAAVAQANASLVLHTVTAAAGAGMNKYLDLGCGFPREDRETAARVAHKWQLQARVVNVDNDPMAVACQGRAMLAEPEGAWLVEADARVVPAVLREAGWHLDFEQPTAVIIVALVHFWPDHEDPYSIVDAYREAFPSGWLILTNACADLLSFRQCAKALHAYAPIAPLYLRSARAITAFLGGRAVLEPGPGRGVPVAPGRRGSPRRGGGALPRRDGRLRPSAGEGGSVVGRRRRTIGRGYMGSPSAIRAAGKHPPTTPCRWAAGCAPALRCPARCSKPLSLIFLHWRTRTMAQPELVPAVPTPGLWLEMELVWSRKLCAFYQGPHAVEPLMVGDLGMLRAAEVLVEWVLSEDVWPEPVNLNSLPASGAPAQFSGHDHDEQHFRSR